MNEFVIERDSEDEKIRRELSDAEQAVLVALPDPAEVEAIIQVDVERKFGVDASEEDKVQLMIDADLWRAINPTLTLPQARTAVRARYQTHLRTLRGL